MMVRDDDEEDANDDAEKDDYDDNFGDWSRRC